MALANSAPVNTRAVIDVNYKVTAALPVAGANTNTSGLDLIQATPFPTTQYCIAQVLVAASTAGANNKNINVVLQDSANNVTFANIALLANPLVTVTDNNGGGWAAASANVTLPPSTRQYVRAQAVGEANGSNGSAVNMTLQLLF